MNETVILCIDEEEEIRRDMKAVIEDRGWKGMYASRIEEAIRMITERTPDVIILDCSLRGIGGTAGMAMIREKLPRVPVIISSDEDDRETADRFLEAGASDFAVKPLRGTDIAARIMVHLRAAQVSGSGFESVYADKGISNVTLSLIKGYLKAKEGTSVEEIAGGTGLAYQTVYRYIQFMLDRDMIEAVQSYGKVGRPKRRFKIKK